MWRLYSKQLWGLLTGQGKAAYLWSVISMLQKAETSTSLFHPCHRTLAPQKNLITVAAESPRSQWQLQQREPTRWPPEMGLSSDPIVFRVGEPGMISSFFSIFIYSLYLLPLSKVSCVKQQISNLWSSCLSCLSAELTVGTTPGSLECS